MALTSLFRRPSFRRSGVCRPKDLSLCRRVRRKGQPPSCGSHAPIRAGGTGHVSFEGHLKKEAVDAASVAADVVVSSAEELADREAELIASVPELLDQMNSVGKENNKLQVELSRAKDRYERRDRELKLLYEEMRKEYGQAVDQAEPYFKATQELTMVSHRVRSAVGEFKAAAALYVKAKADLNEVEECSFKLTVAKGTETMTVSKLTQKVERTREERDLKETAYANALQDYLAVQVLTEAQRAQVSDATIRAAQPGFRKLHQQQSELCAEKVHMDAVEAKSETARVVYSETLVELDRISNAVRQVQEEFARRSGGVDGNCESHFIGSVAGDSSDSTCWSVDGFSDPTALAPELPFLTT